MGAFQIGELSKEALCYQFGAKSSSKSPFSSVVERLSCKQKVCGSILQRGIQKFLDLFDHRMFKQTLSPAGLCIPAGNRKESDARMRPCDYFTHNIPMDSLDKRIIAILVFCSNHVI